jgi:DNA-binding Lrp family transcriptional regulator
VDLDEVDQKLLQALQQDARRSMRELARMAGVSTPTASAKVKALEALGVIRGYRAVLDPHVMGRTTHVVEVEARPALARGVAASISAREGVEEVLELAGGLLHVRFLAAGHAALQGFLDALHAMDDIQTYRVHTVLAERAPPPAPDAPLTIQVPCHECKGPIHGAGVRKRWDEDGGKDHWFCCRNCAATFEARLRRLAGEGRRA